MKYTFFLSLLFISFTTSAQIPKSRHDGYKKTKLGGFENGLMVKNDRNEFLVWSEGHRLNGNPDPNDSLPDIKSLFNGHKYSFNKTFYSSNYKDKDKFCYLILIYSVGGVMLKVTSKINDAEFEKCKKLLDNQAYIIIHQHGYDYKDF